MPPINFAAVSIAAVVGWLVGAGWYGVLGKSWMRALGWDPQAMQGQSMPIGPMVIALVAQVLMALMLAGVIGHIGGRPNVINGIVSGTLVWLGFVITTITVNNAFQKKPLMLTLIDGGHWLAVLIAEGFIIGGFG
jgi:hypothetical protein